MKHSWEPTDSQGYSMDCIRCGEPISIYEAERWDEMIDGDCLRVVTLHFENGAWLTGNKDDLGAIDHFVSNHIDFTINVDGQILELRCLNWVENNFALYVCGGTEICFVFDLDERNYKMCMTKQSSDSTESEPPIEWKDRTSYSQRSTVRVPRVLVAMAGDVDIRVHRYVGLEGWFLSSHYLGLERRELSSELLSEAKVEALDVMSELIQKKMQELYNGLRALKLQKPVS